MRTSVIPVGESISSAGQSCTRGMLGSALLSEFCIVQVLERPKTCPLYRIVRCPLLGVFLSIAFNGTSIGTTSSGHVSEVAAVVRCSLILRGATVYMLQRLSILCVAFSIKPSQT